ncbi:MAG: cupredoxin domain-containing protein [Nanoarchaeota archaeon]|jgi:plastocyanin domain-containing protein|nr:cupredoxin domain-containing protein [Nanoarchaeota archaeon]
MEIKKSTLYWSVASVAVIVAVVMFMSGGSATGNVTASSGDVQHIVIGMQNYNYAPNVIHVKAGVPVSISLDDSVGGCYRDFMVPGLKLRKYMKTSGDTLEFTLPKGSYVFACSMYMGQGKIIAE